MGPEKSLIELGVPKDELFHFFTFFTPLKVSFSSSAIGNVKSSSTDYNESNNPNLKYLTHIGSEKSLVELEIQKLSFFTFFFTFFALQKSLLFHLKPWFPKTHHIYFYFGFPIFGSNLVFPLAFFRISISFSHTFADTAPKNWRPKNTTIWTN